MLLEGRQTGSCAVVYAVAHAMIVKFDILKSRRVMLCLGTVVIVAVAAGIAAPSLMARYHLSRAEAAWSTGETEASLHRLQDAARWQPRAAEIQLRLARGHRRLGRLEEAAEHLRRAHDLGGAAERIQHQQWLLVAQSGRVHEVEQHLPALLAGAPDDHPDICAAFVKGYCLSLNFAAAQSLLDAWAADFPDSPEPDFLRGDLWFMHEEWLPAADAYRRGLEKSQDRTRERFRLAKALLQLNRFADAEPHFRHFLEQEPQNVEALLGLADCCLAQTKPEEARALLCVAIEEDPDHFEARLKLGKLELMAERPEEALKWLRPIAEKWPEDWALANQMLHALQVVGETEAALEYLEYARRRDEQVARLEQLFDDIRERPHDPELRYQIGLMLLKHRSRDDGVAWLQSVLLYVPRHIKAHEALAEHYERTAQPQLAAQHRRLFVDAAQ
jgi:tetratricopeptide (TPR) repeat protein